MATPGLPILLSDVAAEFGAQPAAGDIRLSNYADESPDGVLPVSLSELINLSASTAYLNDYTVSDTEVEPSSAYAGYRTEPDGGLEISTNGSTWSALLSNGWDTTANTGADYEISVEVTSGALSGNTMGAYPSYNRMDVDRSINVSQGAVGLNNAICTVRIRPYGGGDVVASATITLTASVDPNI